QALPAASVEGLYVHVPFCFHKCHYCDFYSITRQSAERMGRFVELVLTEARRWREKPPEIRPKTVFFGGGTPSLLPLDDMRRLIAGLQEIFDCSAVNEWTIECNPATVSAESLQMLRESGVDRLSFGAQSFNRAELAILERHHEPEDVGRSLELARNAGFDRLNIDLIYAIPGQDVSSWAMSLEEAIALGTDHLSCYGLTYESNTPMAVKKRLGTISAVDEEVELEMLHRTRRRLGEAGFAAYEISNYAKSGEESRHNLMYWNGGNYLGLGPAAASHVEGHRWKNRPHLGEWESAIEKNEIPAIDVEQLSASQRASELIMLQLRLMRGVDLAAVERLSGVDPREEHGTTLQRLAKLKLINLGDDSFHLTESGIDVADSISAEFA
ncbi:MAG TPA: radical SAM family heme chaperone HemW, partial [Tepidisphaeraceae bacterium]|nr:radical SAM family heme chaperone HemW [Tepidisphaeraceae bacterium]